MSFFPPPSALLQSVPAFSMAFTAFQELTTGSTRLNPEHSLLGDGSPGDGFPGDVGHHALKTAPIFTEDVLHAVGPAVFPQRAFYGRVVSQHVDGLPGKTGLPGVYVNTNAPFSALVCGVQVSTFVLFVYMVFNDTGRVPAKAILRPSSWKVALFRMCDLAFSLRHSAVWCKYDPEYLPSCY
jgi:hypothetical protein